MLSEVDVHSKHSVLSGTLLKIENQHIVISDRQQMNLSLTIRPSLF